MNSGVINGTNQIVQGIEIHVIHKYTQMGAQIFTNNSKNGTLK